MCGRYTLSELPEWSELGIRVPDELLVRPRYNAAPGRPQLVVTRNAAGQLTLSELPWGAHAGGHVVPNARRESLGFRTWREHVARCVVPADGYVEWQKTPEGKRPLWFRSAAAPGEVLFLAGLVLPDGFVVVTTPPSRDVAPVHERMPAILLREQVDTWLSAPWPAARALLEPAPDGSLTATPISTRINAATHDDPACLAASDAPAQLRLFPR